MSESVTCVECGRTFKRFMSSHPWFAHGLLKNDYYRKHKLPIGSRFATKEYRRERSKLTKENPACLIHLEAGRNSANALRRAKTLTHNSSKGRPLTPEWIQKVVAAAKRSGPANSKRLSQPEIRAKAAKSLSETRKRKYWRSQAPAKLENIICRFCGKKFAALKRKHRTFCSLSCSAKIRGRRE